MQPESDSAVGQHLLETNRYAHNYFDSGFKILITACSQFHFSLLKAVYISRKKNRFVQAKAVRIYFSTVSLRSEPADGGLIAFLFTIDCAISVKCISPYCRLYFSLVHLVLNRSCSPQTRQRLQLKSSVRKAYCESKMKSTLLIKSYSNSEPSQKFKCSI